MRRTPFSRLIPVVALLSALASASVAAADNPEAAALIEQGLDLRQAQRDVEALALFEKAQAIAASPRGQAQVALAQQALGRWLPAERNLRAALDAKDDAWIESRRPILERSMSVISGHLGDVEIVGANAGSVFIDGVRVEDPNALQRLRLEVGRRTFELRAAGFYPFSRVLDVLPGDAVRVEVEQHPLIEDRPAGSQAAATVSPPPASTSGAAPGRTQRTLGWVTLAGAGVFLATGVAGVLDHDIAAGDFNGNATCTGASSSALSTLPQCQGWVNDGNTGQTLAIVGFVGGGVLGALSIALLVTAPSKPKAPVLSFPCSPTRGGASCSLQAAF